MIAPIQLSRKRTAGMTLVEVLIASTVLAIVSALAAVGLIAVQRTFIAADNSATNQSAQLRILDYIAMDLRRALTVSTSGNRVDLTIPDFYLNSTGTEARTPTYSGGKVRYGNSTISVSYYQSGDTIYRSYNGTATALATDVKDFILTPQQTSNTVTVTINFQPRFSWGKNSAGSREGTSTSITILTRNRLSS